MRKRLITGLSALLLIFLLLMLLPTFFKKEVSGIVLTEMNEKLDAKVLFSDADINLWRHFPNLTFAFEDFLVTGKAHFTGDTLLQAKELHLVISSWRFMFLGEVEIRELNLSQPHVHVLVLENGEANYSVVKAESEGDSTDKVHLKIESCQIEGGKLLYEDRESKLTMSGTDIQLGGEFDVQDAITKFKIAGITTRSSLAHEGKKYVINKDILLNLDASYNSETNQFSFAENDIIINQLAIRFDGTYSYAADGHQVDLGFKTVDADFADIVSLSDVLMKDFKKLDIRGLMSLGGNVRGIYNDQFVPTFNVAMAISDGHLKYKSLEKALNDIHLQMIASNTDSIWTNSTFNLTNFSLKMGDNPIRGKAFIKGLRNGSIDSDILARMRLQDLTQIYPIEGLALDGDVSIAFESAGSYGGDITDLLSSRATRIPRFKLDLAVNDAGLKYDRLPEGVQDLHLIVKAKNTSGKFDDTSFRLEKIHGLFGDNPLKGFIHIDGLQKSRINAELVASFNLAEIQNFIPVSDLELKGLLSLDMKVQGELDDSLKRFPIVNATINLKDGYVKSAGYPAPIENAHMLLHATNQSGKLSDTRFLIDTLTYTIDSETFLVEGSISDLERYNYDLAVQGKLYLDKLNAILNLTHSKMSGEVDVNFHTAGNLADLKAKRYHQLPTTGQLKMVDLHFRPEGIPHDINVRQGHLYFSNEKIFLDTLYGSIGASEFNLSGHLYNYLAYIFHGNEKIKGDLLFQSSFFSLNELLTDDFSHRDTVHHDLAMIDVPANIDFVFDSKVEKLAYKDIVLDGLEGELILRDGVLTLQRTKFDVLGSAFEMSGDYDGRNASEPSFDIALKVTDLDINKAHTTFATVQTLAPAAEHTFGIFSLDYKLKGVLHPNLHPVSESLYGNGTVSIRDAKVNGMKVFHHIGGITKKDELMNPTLKNIVMETNVENGVLYVKPFSMKLAGFDTDIEGRHHLSGNMSYVLRIAIDPFDIVKIPLHINGTYDNPKIHLGKGHEEAFSKTISLNN
jgi:AsmA protein